MLPTLEGKSKIYVQAKIGQEQPINNFPNSFTATILASPIASPRTLTIKIHAANQRPLYLFNMMSTLIVSYLR